MVMSRSVEFNDVCGEVSVCLYRGWGEVGPPFMPFEVCHIWVVISGG